ncbi:MAG: hypothetical protein ACT4NU_06210 [Chromatiales bacterium]
MERARSTLVCTRFRDAARMAGMALAAGWCLAAAAEGAVEFDPMFREVFGKDLLSATPAKQHVGSPRPVPADGTGLDEEFAIPGEFGHAANQWGTGAYGFAAYRDNAENLPGSFGSVDELRFKRRLLPTTDPGVQVRYAPDSKSQVWSADLYGTRTLAQTRHGHVHMLAGLKVGGVEGDSVAPVQDSALPDGMALSDAGLVRASAATGTLIGPVVGIAGDSSLGRHRIKGLFQQSMLIGAAESTYREDPDSSADVIQDGVLRFTDGRDVSVPVTEFGFKYVYDVADGISLGLGAFASVWWDAPTAASVGSSAKTIGESPLNEETLVFIGGMGSIEARF